MSKKLVYQKSMKTYSLGNWSRYEFQIQLVSMEGIETTIEINKFVVCEAR